MFQSTKEKGLHAHKSSLGVEFQLLKEVFVYRLSQGYLFKVNNKRSHVYTKFH